MEWLNQEVGLFPLWICPLATTHTPQSTLWKLVSHNLYCDIGIFGSVALKEGSDDTAYNRMIENKMLALGGKKCFYSDSFFSRDTFNRLYNGPEYEAIKKKYDPQNIFPHVYDKCVKRAYKK